ncbi:MAG: cell surface protein [Ignavibacteriae bacterium]|nr:cell surface protein [Ignavibacteriota bacterium]MCB9214792.1 cell surface protein [Ignavibacteria bacterium]
MSDVNSQRREGWGRRTLRLSVLVCLLIVVATSTTCAQPWTPDAVDSYVVGEGGGRGETNLPDNVLGLPDVSARDDVPTIDPAQVLSLGLGGEIVLRFDQAMIVDGPGVDFTVFENPFIYTLGGKERIYAEPGEVSVSQDGIEFFPFPFDSLSLEGCAGVTPTRGDMDPRNPAISGGDGFDLAEIGLDSIRFIRIRDVSAIIKGNSAHPFYDATVNGFDLDAVVGVNVLSLIDNLTGVEDQRSGGGVSLDLR